MPAAIRASSFSDITNLLNSRGRADTSTDAIWSRRMESPSDSRGRCRAPSSGSVVPALTKMLQRPARSSSRGGIADPKQSLEEIWDLGAAFNTALDRLQGLRAAREKLAGQNVGTHLTAMRSSPLRGPGNFEARHHSQEELRESQEDTENPEKEERHELQDRSQALEDEQDVQESQPVETGVLPDNLSVNDEQVRPERRHSLASSLLKAEAVTHSVPCSQKMDGRGCKPGGHFHQHLELWGKREANGFAGKPMDKETSCRLSKGEAEAALQRLMNSGTKVDFDEVRRLRKLINGAGG